MPGSPAERPAAVLDLALDVARHHRAAMSLLHAGTDITVIALWLGHERAETAQIYIHADQTLKQRALDRTTPRGIRPGRYRPPDTLLAFLEQLA